MAIEWESSGAPLIHIVDLEGANGGHSANLSTISSICASVACPCQLGGGIREERDIEGILKLGIQRVILGTSLSENPSLAEKLLTTFKPEQIVAGLDATHGKIATHAWKVVSEYTAIELATKLFNFGIRNFIYTDILTDGMFSGPNYEQVSLLCNALPKAQFIASGGVGSIEHIQGLVKLGKKNLEGVIVGKALYDDRLNYRELVNATIV